MGSPLFISPPAGPVLSSRACGGAPMRPTSRLAPLFALALTTSRCGTAPPLSAPPPSPPPARATAEVNAIAESHVRLVLAFGRHDADYVDAYYGPPEWKAEAERANRAIADIAGEAGTLLERLAKAPEPTEELLRLRHRYLVRQLSALRARAQMLQGWKLTFDEESLALYDAVAPTNTEEHFRALRGKLGAVRPGAGPPGRVPPPPPTSSTPSFPPRSRPPARARRPTSLCPRESASASRR